MDYGIKMSHFCSHVSGSDENNCLKFTSYRDDTARHILFGICFNNSLCCSCSQNSGQISLSLLKVDFR